MRETNSRLTAEVAERQRIEVQLRRSTLFLESVLNAIQDGICVLAPDMTVIKVNKAMMPPAAGGIFPFPSFFSYPSRTNKASPEAIRPEASR